MESRAIMNVFLLVAVLISLTHSAIVRAAEEGPAPKLPVPKPTQINGKTVYVETWFQTSWYRASQFCRYHGMQLLSVNDQKDNDGLTLLLNNTAFHNMHFWTSGNDIDQTNLYTWYSTGSNIINFYNFKEKEPNHMLIDGEVEHCVELVSLKQEGVMWNDVRCSNQLSFICEK